MTRWWGLLLVAWGLAGSAGAYDGTEERPRLVHYSGSAFISNPGGYSLRHDILLITGALPSAFDLPVLGDVAVGGYNAYYVFSDEMGLSAVWEFDPAFLRFGLDLGIEPGRFIILDDDDLDRPVDEKSQLTRRAGARYVGRLVTNGNLRYGGFWIYTRNTLWYRYRPFREWDFRFEFAYDRHEIGIEQAQALMFNIFDPPSWGRKDRPDAHLWLYGEYTVGYIYPGGVMPNRVSMGVLTENFPITGYGFNLDVFYSFAREPQDGLGVILLFGFTFQQLFDYRRL